MISAFDAWVLNLDATHFLETGSSSEVVYFLENSNVSRVISHEQRKPDNTNS